MTGYAIKEIFYTIQGEGANIGRPAVFVRFAGCNLWTGREEDRSTATCQFCDTDFVGGKHYRDADSLADKIKTLWPCGEHHRMVVLTGGEPLLQVDRLLLTALRMRRFYIAVETNGTCLLPGPVDWLCVSPKAEANLVLDSADELKLVYPQPGVRPELFSDFSAIWRWISPMAGPCLEHNTVDAAAYCMAHPEWRLAIQAHKYWNIP